MKHTLVLTSISTAHTRAYIQQQILEQEYRFSQFNQLVLKETQLHREIKFER